MTLAYLIGLAIGLGVGAFIGFARGIEIAKREGIGRRGENQVNP